ncbi:MAG: DUF1385 domain-containing protein [Capsulimonadaceae bacterium]
MEISEPPPGISDDTKTDAAADKALVNALRLLDERGVVPVFHPRTGETAGYLVRRDAIIPEAIARFESVRMGGLATPLGVHLYSGAASGGAGFRGLVAAGILYFVLGITAHAIAAHLVWSVCNTLGRFQSVVSFGSADLCAQAAVLAASTLIVLLLVRLLPLSGIHGAEHQVVHAVEHGLSLSVDGVRGLPRVHPRCGTNLVVGAISFLLLFTLSGLLGDVVGLDRFDGVLLGLGVAAVVISRGWKSFGGGVQYWLATRTPTDRHIEDAIGAARSVLSVGRMARQGGRIARLLAAGVPQILLGNGIAAIVLFLMVRHWPNLASILGI